MLIKVEIERASKKAEKNMIKQFQLLPIGTQRAYEGMANTFNPVLKKEEKDDLIKSARRASRASGKLEGKGS